MFLTTLIIGLAAAAFCYFWDHIRDVLNDPVRDMLREHYGKKQKIGLLVS